MSDDNDRFVRMSWEIGELMAENRLLKDQNRELGTRIRKLEDTLNSCDRALSDIYETLTRTLEPDDKPQPVIEPSEPRSKA